MRTKLLAFPFLILFFVTASLKAQFPYSTIYTPYPANYSLASGFITKLSPGIAWFGYNSQVILPGTWHDNKNFCMMGTGLSAIWSSYKVFESTGCSGQLSQVLTNNGLSVVETNGTNGLRYAVAGSYANAVYFVGLDAGGQVLNAVSFPFPSTLSSGLSSLVTPPGAPYIIEAEIPHHYYICGTFGSEMYIIKIDNAGSIVWSSFYTLGQSASPKDMIIDPFHQNQLVVVGSTKVGLLDHDAFLMEINTANGSVNNCTTYGRINVNDAFNSITISTDPTSRMPSGFVIGGYQQINSFNGGSAWLIRVDPSLITIWSNIIYTSGTNRGYVDVIERQNTFGDYEFYGLLQSSLGLHVTKLDDHGLPFVPSSSSFSSSSVSNSNNEFIYEIPATAASQANSLDYTNSSVTGGADAGLQVFGTSYCYAGYSGSYAVGAYFNGETNCYKTLNTLSNSGTATYIKNTIAVISHGNFSPCTNFQVTAHFLGGTIWVLCNGYQSSGSNQRPGLSSVEETTTLPEGKVEPGIYPNPVSDRTYVNYSAADNSQVKIDVYTLMGALVHTSNTIIEHAGEYKEEIDFEKLNAEEGVYIVTVNINKESYKQKIIFKK